MEQLPHSCAQQRADRQQQRDSWDKERHHWQRLHEGKGKTDGGQPLLVNMGEGQDLVEKRAEKRGHEQQASEVNA